jgi:pyrroline-5-carboxylate reductase
LNDQNAQKRLQESFDGRMSPGSFLCGRNVEAVNNADAVLFAFPPEKTHEVLGDSKMREALRNKSIISILARTRRSDIAQIINGNSDGSSTNQADDLRIVRAMPTMGAQVHESATLITETGSAKEKEVVELGTWIFNQLGKVFPVTSDYFDAATGMSAFSNALLTLAAQQISQKAVSEGVPQDRAIAIASQCFRGMASLMLSGKSPEELQWSLSAPGSITGQAISNLENSQLSEIIEKTSSIAMARAKDYNSKGNEGKLSRHIYTDA